MVQQNQVERFTQYVRLTVGVLLVIGFILSVLSAYHLCTSACVEGHKYRLFGFHFETFGIAFFVAALACIIFQGRWPVLGSVIKLLVAGALGAELYFLYVQKYMIGSWCPLCVSIATTVGLVGLIYLVQYVMHLREVSSDERRSADMIKKLIDGLSAIAITLVGFTVAFVGIAKVEHSFADTNSRGESPAFGNLKSNVEVYFFTDWFCPACRKTEPKFEEKLPVVFTKARVYFIDVPIHENSLNFLPYHLSFMLKQKPEYLKLRRSLVELAQRNQSPTDSEVETLAKANGVEYRQLDYSEINEGQKYFKEVAKKYSVDSTPTLVITNPTTKKTRKFSGYKQITDANISHIIDQLK